jgi:hypothetical protein
MHPLPEPPAMMSPPRPPSSPPCQRDER